ncbi:MAG: MerR family DNA-binding protein [Betaproteobacteria bacterium]|nr:MerR family DNA-binding protein [Betaproteobacteria bacterium]
MAAGLRISEFAKHANYQIETIRNYERQGLLHAPERTEGNYMLHHDAHVERLRFMMQCRSLDMALEEIRTVLRFRDAPEKHCGDVNALQDEHIGHVARRIAELKAAEEQLKELRRQFIKARAAEDYRILHELAQASRRSHCQRTWH